MRNVVTHSSECCMGGLGGVTLSQGPRATVTAKSTDPIAKQFFERGGVWLTRRFPDIDENWQREKKVRAILNFSHF